MSSFWYNDTGSVWRKVQAFWYNDLSTWRKVKTAWYNDAGTWRKVFTAGFGTLLVSDHVVYGSANAVDEDPGYAFVGANPDGQLYARFSNNDGTETVTNYASEWGRPLVPDGSSGVIYDVRATEISHTSGGSPIGTYGVWMSMSAGHEWGIAGAIAKVGARTVIYDLEFREASSGIVVAMGRMTCTGQGTYNV